VETPAIQGREETDTPRSGTGEDDPSGSSWNPNPRGLESRSFTDGSRQERVVITRNGRPEAVLMAVSDLKALEETLDLLSTGCGHRSR
jgi:hypothetical protein